MIRRMLAAALVVAAALLAAACGPTDPAPAAAKCSLQQVLAVDTTVTFKVNAYDPGGNEFPIGINVTVSSIGVDHKEALYCDQATGQMLPGPQPLPGRRTPYVYVNEHGPDIIAVSLTADATMPAAGTLQCSMLVDGEPHGEPVRMTAARTGPLTVICLYA